MPPPAFDGGAARAASRAFHRGSERAARPFSPPMSQFGVRGRLASLVRVSVRVRVRVGSPPMSQFGCVDAFLRTSSGSSLFSWISSSVEKSRNAPPEAVRMTRRSALRRARGARARPC
eukprot:3102887-Prymnesium_polylepis.1